MTNPLSTPYRCTELGFPACLMQILNCTPDSFSDGGVHNTVATAVAAAAAAERYGVQFFDVGGESTRPGAQCVTADEELHRVLPVIEALAARFDVRISIDTSKAVVAAAALDAGASVVNDVTAGADGDMFAVVAAHQAPMVLMHMQGTPAQMQDAPHYDAVIDDICHFFTQRIAAAEAAGVDRQQLILDPGIGFGKTLAHNTCILQNLAQFTERLQRPLLLGVSRKSFLPKLVGHDAATSICNEQRDTWSHHVHALIASSCSILRVHDVRGAYEALRIARALHVGAQSVTQKGILHV